MMTVATRKDKKKKINQTSVLFYFEFSAILFLSGTSDTCTIGRWQGRTKYGRRTEGNDNPEAFLPCPYSVFTKP